MLGTRCWFVLESAVAFTLLDTCKREVILSRTKCQERSRVACHAGGDAAVLLNWLFWQELRPEQNPTYPSRPGQQSMVQACTADSVPRPIGRVSWRQRRSIRFHFGLTEALRS